MGWKLSYFYFGNKMKSLEVLGNGKITAFLVDFSASVEGRSEKGQVKTQGDRHKSPRAWGPENRQVQKSQRRGNWQELQLERYGRGEGPCRILQREHCFLIIQGI